MFTAVYVLTETSKGRNVNYGDFARSSQDQGWRRHVEFVNQMLVEHNCSIRQLILQVTMMSALAYAAETEFVLDHAENLTLASVVLAFAWAAIDICIARVEIGQLEFQRSAAKWLEREAVRQLHDLNMRAQLDFLTTQQQTGFSRDQQEEIINNYWKINRLEAMLEDLDRTIQQLASNSTP